MALYGSMDEWREAINRRDRGAQRGYSSPMPSGTTVVDEEDDEESPQYASPVLRAPNPDTLRIAGKDPTTLTPQEKYVLQQRRMLEERTAAGGGAVVNPIAPAQRAADQGKRDASLALSYDNARQAALGLPSYSAGTSAPAPVTSEQTPTAPKPVGFALRQLSDGSFRGVSGTPEVNQTFQNFATREEAMNHYRPSPTAGADTPVAAPGTPVTPSAPVVAPPPPPPPAPVTAQPAGGMPGYAPFNPAYNGTRGAAYNGDPAAMPAPQRMPTGGKTSPTKFDPAAARTTAPTTAVAMNNAELDSPTITPAPMSGADDAEFTRAHSRRVPQPMITRDGAVGQLFSRLTQNALWNRQPQIEPLQMPRQQKPAPVQVSSNGYNPFNRQPRGRGGYIPE
ncbi:MAG TPA: hypothetical protein VHF69_14030 [Candidatus Synoicihabitans sp.]|nr:hypothetical protein [Candidatus Synoicihabitans sp.]